ncbi:MAG: cytochrome c oxidase assembly protein subunit 15 [Saprospiraceae bacterium]|jgi:cytochrome c oxidase assembly protein subunit 15|tara:strand:+ start:1959 stop:3038 length:1080 start_codon:yes stop_codon:yes gene_type:complete
MNEASNKSYIKYSWFIMGFVFLVILAGGVVRMTQSGMGCPDWPTCFGMWIPPTDVSQLPVDFESYLSKQDIDHSFNVYHTWIEYINRLLGAILGVFIFIYAIWTSIKFSTRKPKMKILLLFNLGLATSLIIFAILRYSLLAQLSGIAFLLSAFFSLSFAIRYASRRSLVIVSILLLIAVAIQGWLGKVVVDENLSVVKITIHMIGALVIAALPLINISKLIEDKIQVTPFIKHLMSGMIFIVLIQIILGTQVREEIDVISKALSYEQREVWIEKLGSIFIIHRSFSWAVIIGSIALYFKGRDIVEYTKTGKWIATNVIAIVGLGVIMIYLNVPAISQPLHLFLACALLMQLFYGRIRIT